ncbi:unnamed protein product [Meganyctiphanes norvegica]|uniref:Uncharacterized protein n=1 Tax=Meganyctiphanes norvegica TaxID=48144 RepID=A0AAV2PL57_MEGNR
MTRSKNKGNKKVLGIDLKSKKAKREKINVKKNLLVKKTKLLGNLKDSKDTKSMQLVKTLKESEMNKSSSNKNPISKKQESSPNNQENKNKGIKSAKDKSTSNKNPISKNQKNSPIKHENKNNKKKSEIDKSTSIKTLSSNNQKKSPISHENKKNQRQIDNKKKFNVNKDKSFGKSKNPNNDKAKLVDKNNKDKNDNKNVQKSNSQDKQNSNVFSKQKNVHKMKITVDTVPCPKDIQTQMWNRQLDKNECTLFVRFGKETGAKDRKTLVKMFSDKVKEIRPHKRYKNLNFVEFESREKLEEMKPQMEEMQTAGEKAFVDYMGAKGKIHMQNEEIKINPKKLYMSGFPIGTTPLQVQSLFEKCSKVTIPKSRFLKGKSLQDLMSIIYLIYLQMKK